MTAPATAPAAPRTLTAQRMPELMSTDREQLDELFASTVLAHISVVVDGRPLAMPTAAVKLGDRIVIHGSTGSRWMRALEGREACVAVTRLSGLVVARSMFESSVHYRSAMLFGRFTRVAPERTEELLVELTDRLIPGRPAETRASSKKELAATLLLEMPIEEWSLRVSEGWPEDEPADISGDTWGGVIRFDRVEASAHPAPDLRAGIETPESVRRIVADCRGII